MKKLQEMEEKKAKEKANRRNHSLGKNLSPNINTSRNVSQRSSPRRASSPINGFSKFSTPRMSSSKTGPVSDFLKQEEITEEEEERNVGNPNTRRESNSRSPMKRVAQEKSRSSRSPSTNKNSHSPKFSPNRPSSPTEVLEFLFSGRGDKDYSAIRQLTPGKSIYFSSNRIEKFYLASKNATFHPQISRKSQEIAARLVE